MGKLYPRLAMNNLIKNKQFYLPYLLTVIGTSAAFYIVVALAGSTDLPLMVRYTYLSMFMSIGTFVIGLFAIIFLSYTNSFLMKRRKKELGLYNVLGLGKRHIGRMLAFESLYTAVIGIVGGILMGMLLQKLVTLLLYKIMRFDAYFGFTVSRTGICYTAVLFGVILLVNLLWNLLRIRIQNPMELLRESSAGEKEPKNHWILAVLGVLSLGGGYWIAVTTRTATEALGLYFVAVFLVVIGTYCLFTAISILVLKALRRNKKFYYKTNHFIGISGMLYRMKRNAVGLANICILSTMVLVMVSGTLSLYWGTGRSMDKQFPGNVSFVVRYDATEQEPFQSAGMEAYLQKKLEKQTDYAEFVYGYSELGIYAEETESGYLLHPSYEDSTVQAHFLSEETYERAIPSGILADAAPLTLSFASGAEITVSAKTVTEGEPALGRASFEISKPVWYVLGSAELQQLDALQREEFEDMPTDWDWRAYWNVTTSEEFLYEGQYEFMVSLHDETADAGTWESLRMDTAEEFSAQYFSLNGGFFFLGLFLGVLFILATVLIIYYKQVSEGYEDRERYLIMQKVGMEQKAVRKSVSSQILVVFFAPLLVAGVHVAFDYGLMVRLLTLFSLRNGTLTILCTIGTFCAFCAIYGLVYWATARAYYRIVRA